MIKKNDAINVLKKTNEKYLKKQCRIQNKQIQKKTSKIDKKNRFSKKSKFFNLLLCFLDFFLFYYVSFFYNFEF